MDNISPEAVAEEMRRVMASKDTEQDNNHEKADDLMVRVLRTLGYTPTIYGATYPAFTCCLCTLSDKYGHNITIPRYAQATLCVGCKHTICKDHRQKCGLCLACCWEEHGRHFEEVE